MEQVIQLSQSQFETLLQRLNRLEKMIAKLLEKKEKPVEGSDTWWKLSDKEAIEDIKKGRYTVIHNTKELKKHLDLLKKS